MRAANDSPITILGAILVQLAEPQGKRSTRQMVYITDHVNKIFLSQEACTDLGIIPTYRNTCGPRCLLHYSASNLLWQFKP